ncbi:hypothetical protein HHK36_027979 [Tetracentron sinense]|uniref:Uncharacterized protein n=1 Tax=Tetracentron sinense TaxID=13715 RepID=A0A834YIF0_TETSI|nr:hypothetical protein HHK36_027979 [Tetracentron sinense]
MSSPVLLLLLCLSMHACSARYLGVLDKELGREVHLSGKDMEKAKLDKSSITSKVKPSMSGELRTEQQLSKNGQSIIHESGGGATTNKPKDSKALMKEVEDIKGAIFSVTSSSSSYCYFIIDSYGHAGSEVIVSSSHLGLGQAAKIEGSERRARSVLGSGSHVTEETIDSKENDIVEDVVVMDYEEVHGTPPIHNKEP